jgi:hypothetical protein
MYKRVFDQSFSTPTIHPYPKFLLPNVKRERWRFLESIKEAKQLTHPISIGKQGCK